MGHEKVASQVVEVGEVGEVVGVGHDKVVSQVVEVGEVAGVVEEQPKSWRKQHLAQ